ncbi:MAG: leucine-rich repeat domain-containing protein [Eubacterium sp.]|nr:leucine-rich repeat domain-containing protein [Eubacterium sp.]
MKKRLFTVFCTAVLLLLVFGISDTKAALKDSEWDITKMVSVEKNDITYKVFFSKNGQEVWINRIYGYHGTLSIPETIEGRKVTRIGDAVDYPLFPNREADDLFNIIGFGIVPWKNIHGNNRRVKEICIPDTVEVIMPYTFSGFTAVKTVKLPKKLSEIQKNAFYGCSGLKTLVFPESLKKIDPSAFQDCPSLKTLKLYARNNTYQIRNNCLIRKKDKALLLGACAGKKMKIPKGVEIIKENALSNVASGTVFISASVKKMEENALANQRIKDVTVSTANKTFAKDGQCIYRREDKSLAVAIVSDDGVLRISDEVEKITPDYSMVNCKQFDKNGRPLFKRTVFPRNLKKVIGPGLTQVSDVKELYFTGAVPPVIKHSKKLKYRYMSDFPIDSQRVYVPKDYDDVYRAWFKKYDGSSDEYWRWNTYDPTEVFGTAGKQ